MLSKNCHSIFIAMKANSIFHFFDFFTIDFGSNSDLIDSICRDTKNQTTVQQLMNGELEDSLEGFVFDPAVCRRAFDHYDKDKSGQLDAKEIMKLAEVRNTVLYSHYNHGSSVSSSK